MGHVSDSSAASAIGEIIVICAMQTSREALASALVEMASMGGCHTLHFPSSV